MGNRKYQQLQDKYPWITFTEVWPNKAGFGRYWKRQLSKARRRYAKQMIRFGRGKEPTNIEREVNWKCW